METCTCCASPLSSSPQSTRGNLRLVCLTSRTTSPSTHTFSQLPRRDTSIRTESLSPTWMLFRSCRRRSCEPAVLGFLAGFPELDGRLCCSWAEGETVFWSGAGTSVGGVLWDEALTTFGATTFTGAGGGVLGVLGEDFAADFFVVVVFGRTPLTGTLDIALLALALLLPLLLLLLLPFLLLPPPPPPPPPLLLLWPLVAADAAALWMKRVDSSVLS